MYTNQSRITDHQVFRLTNADGVVVTPDAYEPEPGSVVLSQGPFGTAWQRFFNDGRWHRIGGRRGRSWEEMLTQRNLVLVYDAGVRPDVRPDVREEQSR